jgi:hypothetical protein
MSSAMTFSPTVVIHGPPNDMPSSSSDTLATTQDVRVSIERDSLLCVFKPGPGGSV